MLYSLVGLILSPFDMLLQPFERRLYQSASASRLPQIFVCGAPRSGTTVTAQLLIKHLPVSYLNNLTSLFPRSPIMAQKLFGWILKSDQRELPLDSFYGRTTRPSYPNDALYIWDRWTGGDRKRIPTRFNDETAEELKHFFWAMEAFSEKPLLNKNNSLNTFAHLVAEILPQAYFICLDRDALFLAQSHFQARKFIHGDDRISYGIRGDIDPREDPIEDICHQVVFHKMCIRQQQELIGTDRFIILPYEDFCRRPAFWVNKISQEILGQSLSYEQLQKDLLPLKVANTRKIDQETFALIEKTLARLSTNRKHTHYVKE